MSKLKDMTGQTFGRLTVIERAENSSRGEATWRCKCECGGEFVTRGANLRRLKKAYYPLCADCREGEGAPDAKLLGLLEACIAAEAVAGGRLDAGAIRADARTLIASVEQAAYERGKADAERVSR